MLISHEYTLEIKLLVEDLADGMSSWMLSPLQLDLTLGNPTDCILPGSSVHGDSSGKNTGVGCHAFLQGIFPTQGWNSCLLYHLHWQAGSLPLVPPGMPTVCHVGSYFLNQGWNLHRLHWNC